MATAEISYAAMFLLAALFSVLSVIQQMRNQRPRIDWISVILEAFASVGWLVLVPLHLGFIGEASVFLAAPSIMFFALGVLFLLFTIKSVFDNLQAAIISDQRVDTV